MANHDQPNSLYENQRDSTFVDVAVAVGLDRGGQSYAVVAFDFAVQGTLL